MSAWGWIKELVGPAMELADDMHTSKEEKLTLKATLNSIQNAFSAKLLDYEAKLAELKTSIITTEANSQSWITRNWRPLTMLTFVALLVLRWLGLTDATVPEAVEVELMQLIKIGLGGYVVGRSAEKVVPAVVKAMKNKDEV